MINKMEENCIRKKCISKIPEKQVPRRMEKKVGSHVN